MAQHPFQSPGAVNTSSLFDIKAFLEGPFNGATMNTDLNAGGFIPLVQPYSMAPWNYGGTENVASIPNQNVVDWVLLEFRETCEDDVPANLARIVARQAAFILSDGTITSLDGFSYVQVPISFGHDVYIAIYHRNHLGVMSSTPVPQIGGVYAYDFTTAQSKAYNNGQKVLLGGYGMYAGDADGNGDVNQSDLFVFFPEFGSCYGYCRADADLNSDVNLTDVLDFIVTNFGNLTQIPDNDLPGCDYFDMGDAPEGELAYPESGVTGSFPTCFNVTIAGAITHMPSEVWFGPTVDYENEGNGGICASFSPYNHDEFINDNDAGLLVPTAFNINTANNYVSFENPIVSLGNICGTAYWGTNIDINIHNLSPGIVFVNVLVDWTRDGTWMNDPACNCYGSLVPEHVLVNFPVPAGYEGPLSGAMGAAPGFIVGPNFGHVWARFSVTEVPVQENWTGEGEFAAGETEDYLFLIETRNVIPVSNWAIYLSIGLMLALSIFIYRRRISG